MANRWGRGEGPRRYGGARALLTVHGVDDATLARLRATLIEENP